MDKHLRSRISMTNPWHLLALGFGSGLIPFMPGTMGTLAGLPLVYGASYLGFVSFALLTVLACVVGVIICDKTANAMQVHDHGSIVWDEVAGIMVTFLWVPLSISNLVAGFILFRFFDILKPWPISVLDKRVTGGKGIMIDDIVAGLFSCFCLHLMMSLNFGL